MTTVTLLNFINNHNQINFLVLFFNYYKLLRAGYLRAQVRYIIYYIAILVMVIDFATNNTDPLSLQ